MLHVHREKTLCKYISSLKQCLKSVHNRFVPNKEKHYVPVPDIHNNNGKRQIKKKKKDNRYKAQYLAQNKYVGNTH